MFVLQKMISSIARAPSPSPSPSLASRSFLPRPRTHTHSLTLTLTLIPTFPAAKIAASPSFAARSSILSVMSSPPPPSYRPNVGLCLINAHSRVFIARRVDLPDSWQMPQGGVDEDEEPRMAAFRELKEETGVTSVQLIGETPDWLTYDFPPDVKEKITHLWGKEWKGQAQKWFLFRFIGDESEIILDGNEKERAEFSEWKWASTEEVLDQAVDFKRPVYEKVFKTFDANLS